MSRKQRAKVLRVNKRPKGHCFTLKYKQNVIMIARTRTTEVEDSELIMQTQITEDVLFQAQWRFSVKRA